MPLIDIGNNERETAFEEIAALNCYGCVTNYHKISGLKQKQQTNAHKIAIQCEYNRDYSFSVVLGVSRRAYMQELESFEDSFKPDGCFCRSHQLGLPACTPKVATPCGCASSQHSGEVSKIGVLRESSDKAILLSII